MRAFAIASAEALSKGWLLFGPPTLAFDPVKGQMICGQAVTKDVDDVIYSPDLKLGAL